MTRHEHSKLRVRIGAARSSRRRREGVVMLIVMLIILMATATALFAIHSTAFELRASGNVKQAMQTQYVSETGALAALSWVDQTGPVALQTAMRRTSDEHRAAGQPALDMTKFNEPDLADKSKGDPTDEDGYRMTLADMQFGNNVAPISQADLGPKQAFAPAVYVDVYDTWVWTGSLAGERSDGYSRMQYLRATYTSRGRTRVAGDYQTPGDIRDYHEGANDARAHGLSGPFGARVGGGQ